MQPQAAQKILVERCLDWDRISGRLGRYRAIARTFPLDMLREAADAGPYYCHPIAWRLGTWQSEALLERLDALLELAEGLPGWKKEKALHYGRDFADFWSLIWQLQVAEYLQRGCSFLSWSGNGPDFEVSTQVGPAYVECYVYRKSFGVELFLQELVQASASDAYLLRDHCSPFQVPDGPGRAAAISNFLSPLLEPDEMSAKRVDAMQSYPVVLSRFEGTSLRLVLSGPIDSEYTPITGSTVTGDPDAYLAVVLREVAHAKSTANSLGSHRPNIVLVNLLLSTDAQFAINRARSLSQQRSNPDLPSSIDAVAIAVSGIDSKLYSEDLYLLAGSKLHESTVQLLVGRQSPG